MASLVAHAAIPFVAIDLLRAHGARRRRLLRLGILAACLPDLDVLTYVWELRTTDVWGHRGASHSLAIAALVGIVLTLVGFGLPPRDAGARGALLRRRWIASLAFLVVAAASHGILDALTAGDAGVALAWPLSDARWLSPFPLFAACPGGPTEWASQWGLLTLANELLFAVIPLAIIVSFFRPHARRPRAIVSAAVWLGVAIVARRAWPETFAPRMPRVLEPIGSVTAGDPKDIPTRGLPDERLVVRFDDLRARGLFDRTLVPIAAPWSSSFFPSWFGGEGGRWSEGTTRLAWRTVTGFSPPAAGEARAWLTNASAGDEASRARIFTLAPAEKVDLALGRFDFPAAVQALSHSHNGHPRYWSGRCNGVAAAAMAEPEPFRVVDVVGTDGRVVRFHPNDVKSLLSVAYYEPIVKYPIGDDCTKVAFDSGAACSMNPAVLVLALVNQVGLAHESFIIDALPNIARQYYDIAGARVRVTRGPYPLDRTPIAPDFRAIVKSLVDVEIDLTLSSTTLRYDDANHLDPAFAGASGYRRVGVVPVEMHFAATLALGADTALAGGRWTGNPADGPDVIIEVAGGPKLDAKGQLAAADQIPWAFIRVLAHASVDPRPEIPTIDVATACDGPCR